MTSEQGLGEFLADRAHHASDTRLAIDVAIGVVGAVVAIAVRPWAWPALLGASLCFAPFGGWAIADRELADRSSDHGPAVRALRFVRGVSVAVGALAAALMLLAMLGIALGTIIS